MKNSVITTNTFKKHVSFFMYCSFFIISTSCANSLGEKGEWNATYKADFVSNCKLEIHKEESLLQLDSLTITKICDCIALRAEKEFAPLEMEEEKAQSKMKTISTDCARDILIEN